MNRIYYVHDIHTKTVYIVFSSEKKKYLVLNALIDCPREFVIVENMRLICLLDLTADYGVKTKRCEREQNL